MCSPFRSILVCQISQFFDRSQRFKSVMLTRLTDESYLLNVFLDRKLKLSLKFCSSHEYVLKCGRAYFHGLLFSSNVQKVKRQDFIFSKILRTIQTNRSQNSLGIYAKSNCAKFQRQLLKFAELQFLQYPIHIVSSPLSKEIFFQWLWECLISIVLKEIFIVLFLFFYRRINPRGQHDI